MIQQSIHFVSEHRAALATAGMAAVHFAHLAWPRLVSIFGYCRDNGGACGLLSEFFHGKPKTN